MKKRLTLFLCILLFLLPCLSLWSFDFGLLVDQKFEAEKSENILFSYTPGFAPWFSWDGGKGLSLYFSGLVSMKYNKSDDGIDENDNWGKPVIIPELTRFSLSYRSGNIFSVELGRISYSDALGLTSYGLFDGLGFRAAMSAGNLSAGVFYTGLLYKETAEITMTASDINAYANPRNLEEFADYFASRRLMASLRWDMPLGEIFALSLETLAQFDLNGREDRLHSQYGEVQLDLFLNKTGITFGAVFEAMENENQEFAAAIGALARLKTEIPGSLNDGIDLTAKFGSGAWNDTFVAFAPVNSTAQGAVFSGTLPALAVLSAGYNVRFHRTLLADLTLRYFMKTYDDPSEEGSFYGGEFWASVIWQPLDDIRVNLGGGVFFPRMGNLYPSDTGIMWKINAGLSLSF